MGLFSSTNPKEQKHTGVVGSFSVDLIKLGTRRRRCGFYDCP